MFDLKNYIDTKSRIINDGLEKILDQFHANDTITQAMRYSLMAGGKRIRPIFCLAAAEAINSRPDDVLTAACALEMIHTYSLIHDDLPAMDDDDLRRGKPTCHMAFDEATAILAGDALLTLAFEKLASTSMGNSHQAGKWLQVIQIIATAAGSRGMIQGQMLDIAAEGHRLEINELESMHALKTGALIGASLRCGAVLAGASQVQINFLDTYARNIGLAFQVADDILNVEGNPALMGKAVGTDKLHEKCTYPSVIGLEASKKIAKKLVRQALQALKTFDNRAEPLRAIGTYVIERKR
jgi:geranylgeranyl diphosphate synthase type II